MTCNMVANNQNKKKFVMLLADPHHPLPSSSLLLLQFAKTNKIQNANNFHLLLLIVIGIVFDSI
ncbi:hypothetical protein DERF_004920 [Dermatophagoides farinae]|uniref:Uncharacterized protein n=1 Tax=Dermatophagoides farinae TaxID=6954 RepID=A0A922L5P7_DERFA|nr:hypothetical protein DERF_004920 [Dermatophagoides farinae]